MYSKILYVLLLASFCVVSSQAPPECVFDDEANTFVCRNVRESFPYYFYGRVNLLCSNCVIPKYTPKTFPYDNALVSFNVSNSRIEIIESRAFTRLLSVQYLLLHDNKIRHIARDAFLGLDQLFELNLARNQLRSLTPGFLNGSRITSIKLSDNALEEIANNAFAGATSTLQLDLSKNKINVLNPESFSDLFNLEYLELSNNLLCSIPLGAFKSLEALKELSLQDNRIRSVGFGTFSGLKNLNKLNLSGNALSELDPAVLLPFLHIFSFDVSRNGLFFLDAYGMKLNAPSLRDLALEDNLWSCDLLKNVVQYFKSVNVNAAANIGRYDLQNIVGIACIDTAINSSISMGHFLQALKEDSKKYFTYC